ncbi:MAG: putative DNA modification/repair radical SAM protein [Armatimonadia bacterium]|nr:putative DNA modification/repair radical SAM protein [Armatimonadia bacterium]
MENGARLRLLGDGARHDVSVPSTLAAQTPLADRPGSIYEALSSDGGRVRLLKVLLSNACRHDCTFCATRCSRDIPRASFRPEELAGLTAELTQATLISGLFLSSGIVGDPDATMARMIETVEILRRKHSYRGYVHLKLLPGCSEAAVNTAVGLADRLSVNVEAPGPERLSAICPGKSFERDLVRPLRWARAKIGPGQVRAGITTQFVVGAGDESDRELLETTWRMAAEIGLARTYFSGFRPIPDTPLAGRDPVPTVREHRLYQAEFLLRAYSFSFDEIIFDEDGMLPTDRDPKMMAALAREGQFPIEVNTAERWELLRVPGIGMTAAERILGVRGEHKLTSLKHLDVMGARSDRARNFVTLNGRFAPREEPAMQLTMGL